MLVLLPVIILLISGLALLILGRTRTTIGSLWMIASLLAVAEWVLLVVLRFRVPLTVQIPNWFTIGEITNVLRFSITSSNWLILFSIITLLVCVIFTDAVRLQSTGSLISISGPFLLTGTVLISVLSSTPLSFILTWTILDIVELCILTTISRDEVIFNKAIISFVVRIIGTLLVVSAMVFSVQTGNLEINQASGIVYLLYFIGAGLRSGALPLHLPFSKDEPVRRSIGTILRFASPISAIALVAQLPSTSSLSGWLLFIFIMAVVLSFYGAAMWLTSRDELIGRQYWILAFFGMAGICGLAGQSAAVNTLGMVMVVTGGFIFTQSKKIGLWNPITLLLLINLFGIPFTPGSAIWMNAKPFPWVMGTLIMLINLVLIIAGLVKFVRIKDNSIQKEEKWIQTFYIAGLIITVISTWMPLIWDRSGFTLYKGWPWSAVLIMLSVLWIAGSKLLQTHPISESSPTGFSLLMIRRSGFVLRKIFDLEWLMRIGGSVYALAGRLIHFINTVLEGEGGILWAFLFLALLASLLSTAG